MTSEIYIVAELIYLMITVRIAFLWAKGSIDQKSLIKGFQIILALAAGTALANVIAVNTPQSSDFGLSCQRISDNWWNCANWPIISDTFGKMTQEMMAWLKAGVAIPAVAGPLLGNMYIAKKMSENIAIDAKDILTSFLAGFIVFIILTRIDFVLTFFHSIIETLSVLSSRISEGEKVLENWLANIEVFNIVAKDEVSIFNIKSLALMVSTALFTFIMNLGSVLLILVQCLLLAFIPLSFFKGLLYENANYWLGLKQIFLVASLGLFKNLLWTLISFLPSFEKPQKVNGHYILENSPWELSFNIGLAGILVLVFYVIVGILMYKVLTNTFTSQGVTN